jgi:trigger factor
LGVSGGFYLSYKIKSREKIDLNKSKLVIEVPNSSLKKNITKAYKKISSKANIPGFRKGKIPYQVIDVNYGKNYVLGEAASLLISELYPDIIVESDLKTIDYPKVKITQLQEDLPLVFEVEVELEPEIKLPDYKGIEVTGLSTDVSDQEVENQINSIRKNFATLEPVENDKPVSRGDFVTLDFDGEVGGKKFEGGSAEDYLLEVGSNTLLADFENLLVGIKKGEKKKISLTLPVNIEDKKIAGKKASFNIFIKDIKRKVLPEVNQEFLKNLGDYKDADSFKNSIRERMVKQKKGIRKDKIVGEILRNIIERMKDDVPVAMVNSRVEQINKSIDENLEKQKIKRADYLRAMNLTEDKLNRQIKERAVREVKEYLIFRALEKAEKKNIEPSEDEIKKEKDDIIKRYKEEDYIKKIEEFLEKPEGDDTVKHNVRRKKIIDLLVESSKVVDGKNKDSGSKSGLWTPDKGKEGAGGKTKKLWTPDSK